MSSVMHPIELESTADLPPGAAPSFGDAEGGTVPEPAPLVMSESAHRFASAAGPLPGLNGRFHLDDPVIDGQLSVEASDTPGMVRVHADLAYARGGSLHFDAEVRQSWILRAAAKGQGHARAQVARALADLAGLPHQSTVTVSFGN